MALSNRLNAVCLLNLGGVKFSFGNLLIFAQNLA